MKSSNYSQTSVNLWREYRSSKWISMLINVQWCTLDTTYTATTITCPINSCQQQMNSSLKTTSVKKQLTHYWGSLSAISSEKVKEIIHPRLYKSFVRPQLEYGVHFWSPHIIRDIDKITKVSTKMIPEIRNRSCSQRLRDLCLVSLVQRRLRGQLVVKHCFNI